MNKVMVGFIFIFLLGLVIWNIYLTDKVVNLRKSNNELLIKMEACNGNIDVLSYDLVTSRDSVRILNNKLEAYSID